MFLELVEDTVYIDLTLSDMENDNRNLEDHPIFQKNEILTHFAVPVGQISQTLDWKKWIHSVSPHLQTTSSSQITFCGAI